MYATFREIIFLKYVESKSELRDNHRPITTNLFNGIKSLTHLVTISDKKRNVSYNIQLILRNGLVSSLVMTYTDCCLWYYDSMYH